MFAVSLPADIAQVFCVYNVDAGFIGELQYITGKISGRAHCALCDITHGWAWKGREEWRQFLKHTRLSFQVVHRNEQPESLALYTKDVLPCVVVRRGGAYEMVMTPVELEGFGGNTQPFLDCLSARLGTLGLSLIEL